MHFEIQCNTAKTGFPEKLLHYMINQVTAKFIRNSTSSQFLQLCICYAKSRYAGNVLYFPIQAMSLQSTVFAALVLALLPPVPTQLKP